MKAKFVLALTLLTLAIPLTNTKNAMVSKPQARTIYQAYLSYNNFTAFAITSSNDSLYVGSNGSLFMLNASGIINSRTVTGDARAIAVIGNVHVITNKTLSDHNAFYTYILFPDTLNIKAFFSLENPPGAYTYFKHIAGENNNYLAVGYKNATDGTYGVLMWYNNSGNYVINSYHDKKFYGVVWNETHWLVSGYDMDDGNWYLYAVKLSESTGYPYINATVLNLSTPMYDLVRVGDYIFAVGNKTWKLTLAGNVVNAIDRVGVGIDWSDYGIIVAENDEIVSRFENLSICYMYSTTATDVAEYSHMTAYISDSHLHVLRRDIDGDGLWDDEEATYGTDPLNADTDSDNMNDKHEIQYGTDPLNPDTDGDGVSDGTEYNSPAGANHMDPLDPDTDNDGLYDGNELTHGTYPNLADTDGDGLLDGQEVYTYGTSPTNPDTDNDSLSDTQELAIGTNPLNNDTDGDGVSDGTEYTMGTDPLNGDTDGDGLSDSKELELGTNPKNNDTDGDGLNDRHETLIGTNPLNTDTDEDGLGDKIEVDLHTDPLNPDTDGDGVSDGTEYAIGTDPLDTDTDDDGISDGTELLLGADPNNPTSPFLSMILLIIIVSVVIGYIIKKLKKEELIVSH